MTPVGAASPSGLLLFGCFLGKQRQQPLVPILVTFWIAPPIVNSRCGRRKSMLQNGFFNPFELPGRLR